MYQSVFSCTERFLVVINCHSLLTFFGFCFSLSGETEERKEECSYLYFCFAKTIEKRHPQRKTMLRIKHPIEAVLRKVVPWGTILRSQCFPNCVLWGMRRYMKKYSVIKKVWEMLRLAKPDKSLHWRTPSASAASPGWGEGCGRQQFPDISTDLLMENPLSPVLFEKFGKCLFNSSILYFKVSIYK